MSEKPTISSTFYNQLVVIITISSASVLGFRYLGTMNQEAIKSAINPIVERVETLEKKVENTDRLIASNSNRINATMVSINSFLDFYNRTYHKEFLRPMDITERSIVTEYETEK